MEIKTEIERRAHISRYIFGSAVYSNSPEDIDVAIVYDKQYVSVKDAIAYRKEITAILSEMNSITIDAILLSREEEEEMAFLTNAKHYEF